MGKIKYYPIIVNHYFCCFIGFLITGIVPIVCAELFKEIESKKGKSVLFEVICNTHNLHTCSGHQWQVKLWNRLEHISPFAYLVNTSFVLVYI